MKLKLPRRPYLCTIRHRWKRDPKVVWLERCRRCGAQRHVPTFRWGRSA